MEQIVMIEQQQVDLSTLIAQVQNFGKSFVITQNGQPVAQISAIKEKRQLNFGFMNEEFEVPDDFDRMNEDEIYAMFAGEYGENPFR